MNEDAIRAQLNIIRNSCNIIDGLISNPVIPVGPSDNLLSILASAPAGSVLSIDPAFVLAADVVLSKPVTMMCSVPSVVGQRISSTYHCPIITGAFSVTAPNCSLINIALAPVNKNQTVLTTFDEFTFDRCIIDSRIGAHRGILANAKHNIIKDSYIAGITSDIDTQAIVAWDGCEDLEVDNCYLEASGENILFGGADASSLANVPTDISIMNCDIVKLLSWMGNVGITVKNLFEIKCGVNISLTGCRLNNSWTSGQDGYGILLTVRNQDGSAPFSTIKNILIDTCIVDNCAAGIQVLGQDYTNPSDTMDTVTISNSKFTNLNGGRTVFISRGPKNFKLRNTSFEGKNLNSALSFDDATQLCANLDIENCLFDEGDYGIIGTGAPALGQAVLDMYAPGYTWKSNTIVKGTSGRTINYPPGTIVV